MLGDEHGDHGPSAAARRARLGGVEPDQLPALRVGRVPGRAGAGPGARCRGHRVSPGEEAQIDYGYLGSLVRPARRAGPAGVGVRDGPGLLPAHVRAPGAVDGSARAWSAAHVAAFEFFGGVPGPAGAGQPAHRGDHARTCMTRSINRAYAELAAHYGCLIDPARRPKPKDKPRVERPMPYVRDSFWRGREWDERATHAGRGARAGAATVAGRARPSGSRWRVSRCAVFARSRRDALMAAAGRSRSSWRPGRPRRSVRTVTSRSARRSTRCRGVSSAARRRPRGRPDRRGVRRRGAGQDLGVVSSEGPADRLRRLPAREGRVLHAHPGLVPAAGRGARAPRSRS